MPRLPDDAIDRIKREVSVESVCVARGIELRRHGGDLIGSCPFHDDRTPSFVVTVGKNLWHCLGKCQAGGSVVDLVMRLDGVGFRKAAEILVAHLGGSGCDDGSDSASSAAVRRTPTIRAQPSPLAHGAEDAVLLRQVLGYYHRCLTPDSSGWAYLASRGLADAVMIEAFGLGYVDRSLNARIAYKAVKAGAELRERLQRLGILSAAGSRERFEGRIVIPWQDAAGQVAGIYGRMATANGLRADQARHLYLPGPHRGVWNAAGLMAAGADAGSGIVILCEALLDALTFWVQGFRMVTAAYGVNGFTADHRAACTAAGVRGVLIAYDADAAGDAAAVALAAELTAQGIACWRVEFPAGMDANAYALRMPDSATALGRLLSAARWMGAGPVLPVPAGIVPDLAAKMHDSASAAVVAEAIVSAASVVSAEHHEEFVMLDDEHATAAPAATPVPAPAASAAAPALTRVGDDAHIDVGPRRYEVRGLGRNRTREVLRVTLRVQDQSGRLHLDTLDLYHARQRMAFINGAAEELAIPPDAVKHDLGVVLRALEQVQAEQAAADAAAAAATAAQTSGAGTTAPVLSPEEEAEALTLLRDPELLTRILTDFTACGVVGEGINKLVGYIAAVSRKLSEPLAVIVQSLSAAGKSTLMEAIVAFVPEEERVRYSAMTGQSLFYMGQTNLRHKVLAIAEAEGAANAAYALKLLQSEGELTIASTGKDPQTGKLLTQEYRVEGPIMLIVTTTAVEIDEELANRCLVLAVDDDRQQTRLIHQQQRRRQTLHGLEATQDRTRLVRLHRNAQRLLRTVFVNNPWAEKLTFLDDRTRTRRDQVKYLTLIRAIALLHQHQRPLKHHEHHGERLPYIDVTLSDIAVANALAHEVLGRSLDDLPPHSRALLTRLDALVSARCAQDGLARSACWFTRREVRDATRWTDRQVRLHLERLVELEYVLVHRGGRGQSFVYELLYDGQGQDGRPFLVGLIDVARLAAESGQLVPTLPAGLIRPADSAEVKTCDVGVDRDIQNRGFDTPSTAQSHPIDRGVTGAEIAHSSGKKSAFTSLAAGSRSSTAPAPHITPDAPHVQIADQVAPASPAIPASPAAQRLGA